MKEAVSAQKRQQARSVASRHNLSSPGSRLDGRGLQRMGEDEGGERNQVELHVVASGMARSTLGQALLTLRSELASKVLMASLQYSSSYSA